jgi:pSer/pThr/pTyr-binding forkhead associated (FHA) protein
MNPARITLLVTEGYMKGMEYVVEDGSTCIIGRAEDCDIRLPDDRDHQDVSRHHCEVDASPTSLRIRDLGSRNGTFVNGDELMKRPRGQAPEDFDLRDSPAHELKDGDEIRMGNCILKVGIAVPAEVEDSVFSPMYFM